MRVPAGALTEAACSVDLSAPPSASRPRWRVARSVRCVADLSAGYLLRARPLFALAAPEGVYLSLLSVCPSLPLFCARRAPAKMMRNAEKCRDLEKSQGD